jgi:hypothetical protein
MSQSSAVIEHNLNQRTRGIKAEQAGGQRDRGVQRICARDPARQCCRNGQVEGQVNRLKLIKRQEYGRAGFDLLRLRVLHGSGQAHQQKCV